MAEKNQTQKNDGTEKSVKSDKPTSDLQSRVDKANDVGYFGVVPDEKANDAHTFAGVTKGKKND